MQQQQQQQQQDASGPKRKRIEYIAPPPSASSSPILPPPLGTFQYHRKPRHSLITDHRGSSVRAQGGGGASSDDVFRRLNSALGDPVGDCGTTMKYHPPPKYRRRNPPVLAHGPHPPPPPLLAHGHPVPAPYLFPSPSIPQSDPPAAAGHGFGVVSNRGRNRIKSPGIPMLVNFIKRSLDSFVGSEAVSRMAVMVVGDRNEATTEGYAAEATVEDVRSMFNLVSFYSDTRSADNWIEKSVLPLIVAVGRKDTATFRKACGSRGSPGEYIICQAPAGQPLVVSIEDLQGKNRMGVVNDRITLWMQTTVLPKYLRLRRAVLRLRSVMEPFGGVPIVVSSVRATPPILPSSSLDQSPCFFVVAGNEDVTLVSPEMRYRGKTRSGDVEEGGDWTQSAVVLSRNPWTGSLKPPSPSVKAAPANMATKWREEVVHPHANRGGQSSSSSSSGSSSSSDDSGDCSTSSSSSSSSDEDVDDEVDGCCFSSGRVVETEEVGTAASMAAYSLVYMPDKTKDATVRNWWRWTSVPEKGSLRCECANPSAVDMFLCVGRKGDIPCRSVVCVDCLDYTTKIACKKCGHGSALIRLGYQ